MGRGGEGVECGRMGVEKVVSVSSNARHELLLSVEC